MPATLVKHATSSTFVFGCQGDPRAPGEWRLGLIMHPVRHRLMIPGGHVEEWETQEEAALREVAEETGLQVRLAAPPQASLPPGVPVRSVAQPWWIVEHPLPYDNQLDREHIHVDHLYVAVADGVAATSAELPFGWYAAGELAGLDLYEDTRALALMLFGRIGELAGLSPAS